MLSKDGQQELYRLKWGGEKSPFFVTRSDTVFKNEGTKRKTKTKQTKKTQTTAQRGHFGTNHSFQLPIDFENGVFKVAILFVIRSTLDPHLNYKGLLVHRGMIEKRTMDVTLKTPFSKSIGSWEL